MKNEEEFLNNPDIPELKKKRYLLRKKGTRPKTKKLIPPGSLENGIKIIRNWDEIIGLPSYIKVREILKESFFDFLGIFACMNNKMDDLSTHYTRVDYRCRCGSRITSSVKNITSKKQRKSKHATFKYNNNFYLDGKYIQPLLLCKVCRMNSFFTTDSGRIHKYLAFTYHDFTPVCSYKECQMQASYGRQEHTGDVYLDSDSHLYLNHCASHREEGEDFENIVLGNQLCYECGELTKYTLQDGITYSCLRHMIGKPKMKKYSLKCNFEGCESQANYAIGLPWKERMCTQHSGKDAFSYQEKIHFTTFYTNCAKSDLRHMLIKDLGGLDIDENYIERKIAKREPRNYYSEEPLNYEEDARYIRLMRRLRKEKAKVTQLVPIIDEEQFRTDLSFVTFKCVCGNSVFRSMSDMLKVKKVREESGKVRYLSCLCSTCQNGFVAYKGEQKQVYSINKEGGGSWKRKRGDDDDGQR